MKQTLFTAVTLAFICGCAVPAAKGPQAPAAPAQSGGGLAGVVHETRSYALGKIPDQDREQAFQQLLESAQSQAAQEHAGGRARETGFSYSMTPKGAVYPFSEVEVSCLVQASYGGRGRQLCADFFRIIDSRIKTIAAPQQ